MQLGYEFMYGFNYTSWAISFPNTYFIEGHIFLNNMIVTLLPILGIPMCTVYAQRYTLKFFFNSKKFAFLFGLVNKKNMPYAWFMTSIYGACLMWYADSYFNIWHILAIVINLMR